MENNISKEQAKILEQAISEAVKEPDLDQSVQKMIAYFGTNIYCDRVSVFEIKNQSNVNNSYEWCDQQAEPQITLMQNLPVSYIPKDWMSNFCTHQSVVIKDMNEYSLLNAKSSEFLTKLGIRYLIAVPLFENEHILGFLSLCNPVPAEMDEDEMLLRLLGEFTAVLISRRNSERKLQYLSQKDPLTGLENIQSFRQRVRDITESNWKNMSVPVSSEPLNKYVSPEHQDSYIVYFNASNFKEFNAIYGQREGDKCLIRISQLIREIFETDVACRSYSDHFYVFYDRDDVQDRIQRLHDRCLGLRKHFRVWMRAGVCRLQEPADIYESCDAAKLACDQIPDDTVHFYNTYSAEIMQTLQQEKYIQDNVENAIKKGNILVYFQPVVRAATGKLCNFEALVRWDDPKYGFLSPGVFIPVLEKHHRCYKIDSYVVEECCRMLSMRLKKGLPCVPVSFNISRTDFMMCDPVRIVTDNANKYGIDHRYLCVEITESSMMEAPEKIRTAILRFKKEGFQVWMDDFGSAYSSLVTLKDYEFDEIKLDMAFMRNMNQTSKIIIISAIQMAKRMGIHTLCEGVETQEQLDFLKEAGCEKIQGYYYGRPMPLEEQLTNLENKGVYAESREEALKWNQIAAGKQDNAKEDQ